MNTPHYDLPQFEGSTPMNMIAMFNSAFAGLDAKLFADAKFMVNLASVSVIGDRVNIKVSGTNPGHLFTLFLPSPYDSRKAFYVNGELLNVYLPNGKRPADGSFGGENSYAFCAVNGDRLYIYGAASDATLGGKPAKDYVLKSEYDKLAAQVASMQETLNKALPRAEAGNMLVVTGYNPGTKTLNTAKFSETQVVTMKE